MTLIQAPDQVTPDWLTGVLRERGRLPQGRVTAVHAADGGAAAGPGFNPRNRLQVAYSADAPASAPRRLYLKLDIAGTSWRRPCWLTTISTAASCLSRA